MKIDDSASAEAFWRLTHLTDDQLLAGLGSLTTASRRVTARLIAHLGEVEDRRLHLRLACPSMFVYCTDRLELSEDEACRRIEAARIARRAPLAYSLLDQGKISLTVLCLLKGHLTADNHDELLRGVSGKSVRAAREWLAARFPEPDAPTTIRKLPERRDPAPQIALGEGGPGRGAVPPSPAELDASKTAPSRSSSARAPVAGVTAASPAGAPRLVPGPTLSLPGDHSRPLAPPPPSSAAASAPTAAISSQSPIASAPLPCAPPAATGAAPRPRVDPISEGRFRVQFTASTSLKEKLELARDLISHANPAADLPVVVERALDLLLQELMKKRFGETARPARRRDAQKEHVCSETRRAVVHRDGLACSYVDAQGRRCGARAFLQHDHVVPRGRGGSSNVENVRLMCAGHNRLLAEDAYGRDHVERAIARRRGHSSPDGGSSGRGELLSTDPRTSATDAIRASAGGFGLDSPPAQGRPSCPSPREPLK